MRATIWILSATLGLGFSTLTGCTKADSPSTGTLDPELKGDKGDPGEPAQSEWLKCPVYVQVCPLSPHEHSTVIAGPAQP